MSDSEARANSVGLDYTVDGIQGRGVHGGGVQVIGWGINSCILSTQCS